MRLWLSHVRHVEAFVADHSELVDVWPAAGVDGLVLGPMVFDAREVLAHSRGEVLLPSPSGAEARATFTPQPGVYRTLGLTPPAAPAGDDAALRRRLDVALQAVKERGWQLWLFDPFAGAVAAGPNSRAELICDERARLSLAARLIDTAEAYPMADGLIIEEWADFDRLITPEFLAGLVDAELGAAASAVGDRAQLVPWIDRGRAPHDGDPITAAHLEQILCHTDAAGVERFLYFNATKVTEADWSVISRQCGTPWQPPSGDGWRPPDRPTL